jgi:hypothetical protein
MVYGLFLWFSHTMFRFGVDKQVRLKKRRSLSSFAKGLGFVFEVDKRRFCCYICMNRKPNTWRALNSVTAQRLIVNLGRTIMAPGGYSRRFFWSQVMTKNGFPTQRRKEQCALRIGEGLELRRAVSVFVKPFLSFLGFSPRPLRLCGSFPLLTISTAWLILAAGLLLPVCGAYGAGVRVLTCEEGRVRLMYEPGALERTTLRTDAGQMDRLRIAGA